MSKTIFVPSALVASILLFAGSASAQTWYDAREAGLRARMQEGRADGSLTRQEYRSLGNGMQRIERYENYAERDGRVSGRERATLDRMLDQQSRNVYRQSNDRQQSHGGNWSWNGQNGGGNHNGWGSGNHQNWGGHDGGRHADWQRNDWNGGWNHGTNTGRFNGFDRREANQQQRIHNGMRDGSLTHGEAARLQQGQQRIDRQQARARADGTVTPRERQRMQAMQNNQSQRIHDARTNTRTQQATAPTSRQGGSFTRASGSWGGRSRSR